MLLVPPVWTNDSKGNFFENFAATLLKRMRYRVRQRIRFTGMEIDLLATHQDTRQRAFVECKFTRDTLSASVIDTLIGKSVRRNADLAFLFSTSPPGKEAQGVLDEMTTEPPSKFPHFAFIGPETLAEMFCIIHSLEPPKPREEFDVATLVISPSTSPFWVLDQESGSPVAPLLIQPTLLGPAPSLENIQGLFEAGEFSGRPLEMYAQSSTAAKSSQLLIRRSGHISQQAIDALHELDKNE